jgi:putative hemolysin
MKLAALHEPPGAPRRLTVELATATADIEAAQRLRFRVFAGEMGARIRCRTPNRDEDIFDPWCDHLIVRDPGRGGVVGTFRILTAERARRIGTYCTESHFDLTRLAAHRPRLIEIGRACIHPDYRNGATMILMWQGIARFLQGRGAGYLIGSASITMNDGGAGAIRVYRHVAPQHLAPIEYRVRPRHVLIDHDAAPIIDESPAPDVSPLLKGCLRIGAWIGGEPSWDPDLNTADLFLLLPLARVHAMSARRFLERAA